MVMYWRRPLSHVHPTATSHIKPFTFARLCRSCFSTKPRRLLEQSRPATRQEQSNAGSTDGKEQRKRNEKHSAVRPVTFFAFCLPVGYGLNWYLKTHNGQPHKASADGFVVYTLCKKEDVSSTCSIFTLKPSSPSAAIFSKDRSAERAIQSVQFKQPQLQIARFYTLLPQIEGQDDDELQFLIRKEHHGEVSGYLHKLQPGSEVELRGPSAEYLLPASPQVERVIFLAGGTGIAPAMQVAEKLAGQASVHILWANRRREDCLGGTNDTTTVKKFWGWNFTSRWSPFDSLSSDAGTNGDTLGRKRGDIVMQLQKLQQKSLSSNSSASTLQVDYYVDEEETFVKPKDISQLLQPTVTGLPKRIEREGKNLLFVSGPEGFVNYWAGPKLWVNGREIQGPLEGVLKGLDLREWEVVKL